MEGLWLGFGNGAKATAGPVTLSDEAGVERCFTPFPSRELSWDNWNPFEEPGTVANGGTGPSFCLRG